MTALVLPGRLEHHAMANIQQSALPRPGIWPQASMTGDDLASRLDLIEDRPENVLTWSDVASFVRSIVRQATSRRRR
jgi:hypothetical protein